MILLLAISYRLSATLLPGPEGPGFMWLFFPKVRWARPLHCAPVVELVGEIRTYRCRVLHHYKVGPIGINEETSYSYPNTSYASETYHFVNCIVPNKHAPDLHLKISQSNLRITWKFRLQTNIWINKQTNKWINT